MADESLFQRKLLEASLGRGKAIRVQDELSMQEYTAGESLPGTHCKEIYVAPLALFGNSTQSMAFSRKSSKRETAVLV